jgi:hypothetical protein
MPSESFGVHEMLLVGQLLLESVTDASYDLEATRLTWMGARITDALELQSDLHPSREVAGMAALAPAALMESGKNLMDVVSLTAGS